MSDSTPALRFNNSEQVIRARVTVPHRSFRVDHERPQRADGGHGPAYLSIELAPTEDDNEVLDENSELWICAGGPFCIIKLGDFQRKIAQLLGASGPIDAQ